MKIMTKQQGTHINPIEHTNYTHYTSYLLQQEGRNEMVNLTTIYGKCFNCFWESLSVDSRKYMKRQLELGGSEVLSRLMMRS